MYKKIVFAFCGYLISCGLFAQTNEIEKVLQEVEKNNNELQAFAGLIESKKLELNASNNLSDIETRLQAIAGKVSKIKSSI